MYSDDIEKRIEYRKNELNRIANMSNKEAAAVIKSTLINQVIGRANGKTIMVAALNQALMKAVVALEKMPDEPER